MSACYQGRPSDKPPIHINPNMDQTERFNPQSENDFFANRSSMRMPVEGTVARGELREDTAFYFGVDASGDTLTTIPITVNMDVVKRGQERYNIYCTPCHGSVGDGKGIVVSKGYIPPTDFHTDLVRGYKDGHIYSVISNGIRNMPAYAHQISPKDRWAIVAYVRALQRSQNAALDDVPEDRR